MAHLVSEIKLIGPVGGLSFYKRRDSDKIIIRAKGGASKEKIKTSERFAKVRRNNSEFGGRSSATKQIMHAMHPLKFIADYNIAGPLNNLLKPIQALDTVSDWGQRNVMISYNSTLLEGFNLNRKNSFDSMVRNPLQYSLSKETFSGYVEFPALLPGNSFILPEGNYPYYRFMMTLGIIPDILFTDHPQGKYRAEGTVQTWYPTDIASEWYPVSAGSSPKRLDLQIQSKELPPSFSLMLSAGVCFGEIDRNGAVIPVKYVGCAKIVAMA